MPSVLLLFEYATLNGGEYSILALLPELIRRGYRFAAAARPNGPLAETLASRDVAVAPLDWHDAAGHRRPLNECRAQLANLLADHRPDLLHANSLAMGRLSGPVAEARGIPSVAHLRDILTLSAAAIADLNRHTRRIAVSRATRDAHVAQGLDASKTCVVHNGVDLDRFQTNPTAGGLRDELGLSAGDVLVANIGQLVMRKGQDVLAAAAARLAAKLPHVHYLFAGERYSQKAEAVRYEQDLRAAFNANGLAGRAHFVGYRGDIHAWLPEVDLVVHCARQEPLGRVLLEAAATGRAVIATDVGGTREIFPALEEARLIPPDDPEALATAVEELTGDSALRAAFGIAARRRACEAFDATRSADATAAVYAEALAE